jgi:arabinan endo-1,5-alpha-L-arabinosidase
MNLKRGDIHIRDPFVLPVPAEGRYYLFGTTAGKNAWSGPGLGFDCFVSRDLEDWEGPIAAFRPPENFWANTQFWAAECHVWQGRYYLLASFARDERQRGTQILVADRGMKGQPCV